jgi:hypothetical protein
MLRKMYGSTDNIDLWVGIIGEEPVADGIVG